LYAAIHASKSAPNPCTTNATSPPSISQMNNTSTTSVSEPNLQPICGQVEDHYSKID
jgi:hypothetical protein